MGTQVVTLSSTCLYLSLLTLIFLLVFVVMVPMFLAQVRLELTMQPRLVSNLLPQPSKVPKF